MIEIKVSHTQLLSWSTVLEHTVVLVVVARNSCPCNLPRTSEWTNETSKRTSEPVRALSLLAIFFIALTISIIFQGTYRSFSVFTLNGIRFTRNNSHNHYIPFTLYVHLCRAFVWYIRHTHTLSQHLYVYIYNTSKN